jgi:hypothetical protein
MDLSCLLRGGGGAITGQEEGLGNKGQFSGYTPMKYLEECTDSSQDDSCFAWRRQPWQKQWIYSPGQKDWNLQLGSKSTDTDADYVAEHQALKYLRNKIAHYLHDYRRHWFPRFGLPPPNGEHDQLLGSQIRWLMRRVQRRKGHRRGGGGGELLVRARAASVTYPGEEGREGWKR